MTIENQTTGKAAQAERMKRYLEQVQKESKRDGRQLSLFFYLERKGSEPDGVNAKTENLCRRISN